MSIARDAVEEALVKALPNVVDKTTHATNYNFGGLVWVLLGSWDLPADPGAPGEIVGVVCAVTAGHHEVLSDLVDTVFKVLREDGRFTPVSFDTVYGDAAPVPGRSPDKILADAVNITVATALDR